MLGEALESILPPRVVLDPAAAAVLERRRHSCGRCRSDPPPTSRRIFEQLLSQRLSSLYEPLMLWWTEGSSAGRAQLPVAKGLPHPSTLRGAAGRAVGAVGLAFGRGADRYGGDPGDARGEPPRRSASDRPPQATSGWCAKINEDAFVERSEVGIWAVADGLGGHRDGEVASRMVCDALAELVPDPTFDRTIEAARQRLQSVNDYLLHTGTHATLADRSASTVVALLVRGANLRHPVGGRQSRLSLAARQARALNAGPQRRRVVGPWQAGNVQRHHTGCRGPARSGARPASREGSWPAIDFSSARTV